MQTNLDSLSAYFQRISNYSSEDMMNLVEKYLGDDGIELFVQHLEEFYGVQDEDELGLLAQIMISGFVAAKEISPELQ